jgi:hypothetical protein
MIDRIDEALIQTNTEIIVVDGKTIVRVGYWPHRAAHGDQHARESWNGIKTTGQAPQIRHAQAER